MRRVLTVVLLALALGIGLAAWGAVETARAVGAARDGRAAADRLQRELDAGSWDAAAQQTEDLSAAVDRMATAVGSVPLRLAAYAPVVGRDVRAARDVALGMQEASRALQPLARASRGLTPADLVTDGTVDLERIQSLVPAAVTADRGLVSAHRRIAAIDATTLHEPLRGQVTDLQRRLDELRRAGVSETLLRRLPGLQPSAVG